MGDQVVRLGTDLDPRYSAIVIHAGTVYLTGQTSAASQDAEGQTREVLAKIDKLLQQAGSNKSRVLTGMIWVKNIDEDFKGMNKVGRCPKGQGEASSASGAGRAFPAVPLFVL